MLKIISLFTLGFVSLSAFANSLLSDSLGAWVKASEVNEVSELALKGERLGFELNKGDDGQLKSHYWVIEDENFRLPPGEFSYDEVAASLESLALLFEKALGSTDSIVGVKFWRTYDFFRKQVNLDFKLTWLDSDNEKQLSFFYCHQHQGALGEKLDCHRKRKAGPFEP